MSKVSLFLLLLLTPLNTYGEENTLSKADKNKLYSLADDFAKCSALYKTISVYMPSDSEKNHYKGLSNGAFMAGAWVLFQGYIMDWKNALGYIERVQEVNFNTYKMLIEKGSPISQELNRCSGDLLNLQSSLVQELRRSMHESGVVK